MKNRRDFSIRAALVVATALAVVQAASAQSGVVVRDGDLDLSQPEGAATLHGRLRAAARTVCGAPERENLSAVVAKRDCFEQSMARAMRDVEAGRQLVASSRP